MDEVAGDVRQELAEVAEDLALTSTPPLDRDTSWLKFSSRRQLPKCGSHSSSKTLPRLPG